LNKAQAGTHIDRAQWTVLALAIVVYLIACSVIVPFTPDDSFISFRYAEHLAEGKGLRFNASDPPVEGYSNLLWIGVCAVINGMGLALPIAAPVVGGLFGVLTLAFLWHLFIRRRMPALQMLLPMLLAATAGPLVIYSISGLETSLFAFLLLLLLIAYDNCCHRQTADAISLGFVGFLVALCRPEGVVALPVVLLTAVIAQRGLPPAGRLRRSWFVSLGVFVVLYALYTGWRVNYFGGFWPTPFLSKSVGTTVFVNWLKNLGWYFVKHSYEFPPLGYYFTAVVVLAFLGMRRVKEKGSLERVALVLGLVYTAIYINFLDWMPGMRYHAPLLVLFFLPAAHVQEHVFRATRDAAWRRRYVLVAFALLLVNSSVLMELRLSTKRLEEGTQLCLKALGQWIDKYTPADWRVAISDVGALPYYSNRYTIDINPESLTDLHIARHGWDAEYVLDKRPEIMLLVSRGVFSPHMYPEHFTMGQMPRFSALYRFLGTVRYGYTEDRCYWMFVPKSWPPLSDEAYDAFPEGIGSMRRLER
jgi:arabinofuranosyltransferase